jgi:alpha-N-arabinofuranosidase
MKMQNVHHYLLSGLGAVMLSAALSGCHTGGNGLMAAATDSLALFSHFRYTGNDAYYNEHPLPDDASFYSAILPGWYSDPSVCTNGEGDYYLATSTFTYYPGVPLFHSRDLVNWRQVGHVLNRPSQLVNMPGQHVSGGIFAPALAYNQHNHTYYMITTNVGAGNFFVKTQDPEGEWSDPIPLPEVRGIDPSFFFDEDGRAYIVNNDDAPDDRPEYSGHRTIRVQEFDVKNDCTVGPRKILVNKGAHPEDNPIWIEGPHMYKINGQYFLMSAEGGTGDWHSEVIFRGASPMGPFTPWERNPILTQRHLDKARPYPITCAGHADLIQAKEGDWWGVFLATRPVDNQFENLGRETFLMPVRWSEDGFPYFTQGDDVVPMTGQREGVKRGEHPTFGNFTWTDDFQSDTLKMEWMSLRTPLDSLASLTQYPGHLSLRCAPISARQKLTPALLARRLQHHAFECETRMDFRATDEHSRAGVILFKDETHYYFMFRGRVDGKDCMALAQPEGDKDYLMVSQPLPEGTGEVGLRVSSTDGKTFRFEYQAGDGRWKVLTEHVHARYLSTAEAGGFTGTVVGLYATRED